MLQTKSSLLVVSLLFSSQLLAQSDGTSPIKFSLSKNSVNNFYGTFTTSVPIEVPKFHDIEPEIAFTYDSNGRNGPVGLGWDISGLPIIERIGRRYAAPKGDSTDIILLNGEQLIPCSQHTDLVNNASVSPSCVAGGTHSTRIENYNRISFISSNSTWKVWRKDGTVMTFTGITGTFFGSTWENLRYGLSTVTDTHGNTVNYTYTPVVAVGPRWSRPHIDKITYNSNRYEVKFYWESRVDKITNGLSGAIEIEEQRLRSVAVSVTDPNSKKLARVYKVSYINTGNTDRSKVSSIQMFGKDATLDAAGIITNASTASKFPATTYTYQSNPGEGWEDAPDVPFALMQDFQTTHPGQQVPFTVADIDGDGLQDILISVDFILSQGVHSYRKKVWRNTGTTFVDVSADWAATLPLFYTMLYDMTNGTFSGYPEGRIVELNGDGRPDVVDYVSGTYYAYINTGQGWVQDSRWNSSHVSGASINWIDVNGDQADDRYVHKDGGPNRIEINDPINGGFYTDSNWTPPSDSHIGNWVDIDGDGLIDYIKWAYQNPGDFVRYNTGRGFNWNFIEPNDVPRHLGNGHGSISAYYLIDLNGDRRPDYMNQDWTWAHVYEFASNTWIQNDEKWTVPTVGNLYTYRRGYVNQNNPELTSFFVDMNGDGMNDVVFQRLIKIRLNKNTPELMSEFKSEHGGTTSMTYKPAANYDNSYKCTPAGVADPNGTRNCYSVPFPMWTLASLTVDSKRDPAATTNFEYKGALYDPVNRRFLGYRYVKSILPKLAEESQRPYTETWFKQDYGSLSKPERIDVYTYNSQLGQYVLMTSKRHTYLTNGNKIPYTSVLKDTWSYEFSGSGQACSFTTVPPAVDPCAHGVRTLTSYEYDAFNNVTTEFAWGDADKAEDEFNLYREYKPNLTNYVVDALAYESMKSGFDNSLISKKYMMYDGASLANWQTPPTLGDLTSTAVWLNTLFDGAGGYFTTTNTYYANGLLHTTTDPGAGVTTSTYDSFYGLLSANTQNALSQNTQTEWDYTCNKVKTVTDPNNAQTTTTYDALCRTERIDTPLNGYTRYEYYNIGTPNGSDPQYVRSIRPPAPGQTAEIWEANYIDGLGREYLKMSSRNESGEGHLVHWVKNYNPRGDVLKQSQSYYSGSTPTSYWTQFEYDGLNRPTKTIHPNNTFIKKEYTHNSITVTDEKNHKFIDFYDAAERKVKHREMTDNGVWIEKTNKYNPKGELIEVRDPNNNLWTMVYDSMGRRISYTDPDAGTVTNMYDWAGRTLKTTYNSGGSKTVVYDKLGRMTSEIQTVGARPVIVYSWTYDQPRSGYANIGKVTTHTYPLGQTIFNYDLAGRRKAETVTIGSNSYPLVTTYGPGGEITSKTHPDSTVMTYEYNLAGQLKRIPGYFDNILYDAEGSVVYIQNANNTDVTYNYSAARHWLNSLVSRANNTEFQNLTFSSRDPLGRIQTITGTSGTWDYTYDERGQVRTATGPSYSQTITYDHLGNVVTNTNVAGTYSYGSTNATGWFVGPEASGPQGCTISGLPPMPHAVFKIGTTNYCYDRDGRIVYNTAGRYITYDVVGKPLAVGGESYSYDGTGNRIYKRSGSVVTHYPFGDDYEVDLSTNTTTIYLTLGGHTLSGGPVVKKVGANKFWHHLDHQGSVRHITNGSGAVVLTQSYKAFGEKLATTGTHVESLGFTGQRQDENGLIYLHARYYDPKIARFVTPDPAVPSDGISGLNRYMYADNDPINKEDRNGMEPGGSQITYYMRGDSFATTVTGHRIGAANPLAMPAFKFQSDVGDYRYHFNSRIAFAYSRSGNIALATGIPPNQQPQALEDKFRKTAMLQIFASPQGIESPEPLPGSRFQTWPIQMLESPQTKAWGYVPVWKGENETYSQGQHSLIGEGHPAFRAMRATTDRPLQRSPNPRFRNPAGAAARSATAGMAGIGVGMIWGYFYSDWIYKNAESSNLAKFQIKYWDHMDEDKRRWQEGTDEKGQPLTQWERFQSMSSFMNMSGAVGP